MKHPNRDEWVPYIFGESSPDTARTLDQHLGECADCRNQVDTWRRTLKRLDAWQIPTKRRRAAFAQPGVRWAIAAAIVLGLGFGLGRFSSERSATKSRMELEASLRSMVAAQVRDHVQNAVSGLEVRLAESRRQESERLALEFASLIKTQNEVDNAITQAVFDKLRDRFDGYYLALRKDLETVAVAADEQLQDTQLKLVELASLNQTQQ
jgi:hypothetical protein